MRSIGWFLACAAALALLCAACGAPSAAPQPSTLGAPQAAPHTPSPAHTSPPARAEATAVPGDLLAQERRVGVYTVRLWEPAPGTGMYRHVTISARGGTEIRVEAVAAIADLPAEDVTGDGYPDLALETRQGGSRCCSGTILYSLGPEPVVEPDIAQTPDYYGTGSGAWDDLDGDGTYEFVTRDPIAAFPCTAPTAPVVLRHVPGQGYVGAGPRYVGAFAAEIAALVERAERERESSRDGYRCGVLGLMLAYLYSGQEGVARQELDRLYLGSDRDAFWDDLVTAVRAGRFYVGP